MTHLEPPACHTCGETMLICCGSPRFDIDGRTVIRTGWYAACLRCMDAHMIFEYDDAVRAYNEQRAEAIVQAYLNREVDR